MNTTCRSLPRAAAALSPSLVIVSWSQVLAPGHAAVVKSLLTSSSQPTLLVPADYGSLSLGPDEPELDLRDDAAPQPDAVVDHS